MTREGTQRYGEARWDVSARAANGLRSQSKIAPQESRQASGQCSARTASEDAILQSEVTLKRVAVGHGLAACHPTCL